MAKCSSIEKNKKRKKMCKAFATKRKQLTEAIYNKNLPLEERLFLVIKRAALPRNSAISRVRNRCELTGRPRAYCRQFGLSRNAVRSLAAVGMLPGVVKSSW